MRRAAGASPTLVSACVATYRRPELLDHLLGALHHQQLPPGVGLEVVVVDNDAAGSARPLAERWQAAGLELRYEVQPEPNISLTRNRTVAGARGTPCRKARPDACERAAADRAWHYRR